MSGDDVHSTSPEQDLWRNVLLVAVEDALYGNMRRGTGKHEVSQWQTTAQVRECQSARNYLTSPSHDLSIVCNLAGLDMQAVIDNMKRQIAAAPTPEELAASPIPRRTFPPKPKPEPKPRAKLYTYNGETLTLQEWSERTGLRFTTLSSRMSDHWPLERALTEPAGYSVNRHREKWSALGKPDPSRMLRPARLLTHAGETLTVTQWAARLGIGKGTIDKRLRMGWPIEQVLASQDMRGKSYGNYAKPNLNASSPSP